MMVVIPPPPPPPLCTTQDVVPFPFVCKTNPAVPTVVGKENKPPGGEHHQIQ